MDSGVGTMESGIAIYRIKHAEGARVIEAVMHIGRAAVFNAEAAARQPQGAFIDQGRGTGRAEDRTGLRNCQIATFVDGQGSTVGRAYRYVIQRQRRVAGSGGDDELVGGRAWGDDILPLKRVSVPAPFL